MLGDTPIIGVETFKSNINKIMILDETASHYHDSVRVVSSFYAYRSIRNRSCSRVFFVSGQRGVCIPLNVSNTNILRVIRCGYHYH